jgi:HK97 family phage major capsid protein
MSGDHNAVLEAVENKLAEAIKGYNGQLEEFGSVTKAIKDEVKALAQEHAGLISSSDELKTRLLDVEQLLAGGMQGGDTQERKSWGQSMVESDAFKSFAEGGEFARARIEVKNTILGESGSPANPDDVLVGADRLPGIVPGAFRSLNILDFVNTGSTASNQIEYTRELAWTNDAAETAEGAVKPESDLTFELVQDPVRTIAHFLRASKQILDDAPMLSSYIDRRMRHGVRKRLQTQLINGNGTSPNLAGISAAGRHTAFTPTASEIALDALNRAKYAVIGADYDPNFIWLNPEDWGAMERVKEGATSKYQASDGAALAYINGGMTPLIWGLPVVASNDVPSGQFMLGDSNAFQLFMRQGVILEMFEQDADNVQRNLLTIRAEMRAAFAVYTPAAIQYGDLLA